ncbi:EAL domain-containing protein [Nitratifractor sp.]|uniref:EAL domain-containing protein n=1 Tax=Nitratifractor sp. TaxID=2268144 RepID=UPI0025D8C8CD|nr:EAL domain-containing protein [Nitratifractor sp.]
MAISRLVRKFKEQLLIAFLIIVLGMLYFAGEYLYQNYRTYHDLKGVQYAVDYLARDARLIQAVQKERGLTLACARAPQFCGEAALQYGRTDQAREAYLQVLQRENIAKIEAVDRLLKNLDRLELLRKESAKHSNDPLEIFGQYSQISQTLIRSIDPIVDTLGDRAYLGNLLLFKTLLDLIELEGRERALLMSLHGPSGKNLKVERQLQLNENRLQASWETVRLTLSKRMKVLFRQVVPFAMQRDYEAMRRKIADAVQNDPSLKRRWWKMATAFIDRLYRFENRVLASINEERMTYLERIRQTLFEGVLFLGILVFLLAFYLQKTGKVFDKILERIRRIAFEKKLASVYGDFSENAQQIHTRSALFHSLIQALSHLEVFSFLYLEEQPGGQVIVSENIPVRRLEEKPAELRQAIKEIRQNKHHRILPLHIPDNELYAGVGALGLFPIKETENRFYLLYLFVKRGEYFSEMLTMTVLRMIEAAELALERLREEENIEKMKKELRLYSTAFEAQEAILITNQYGEILKVNKAFEEITGYKEKEVLGKSPSIMKSGRHDASFYRQMWEAIKEQGYWKGEIYNRRKDGTVYPEILSITAIRDSQGKISNYVSHFFDISDLKKAYAESQYRAHHDPLTDLFNRMKLKEELELIWVLSEKEKFYNAFFFIDLDNFKQINDSYGHAVGDKVIIEVARRLKEVARERDVKARISGDEFALVLVDLGEDREIATHNAALLAEKLVNQYTDPYREEGVEIPISYSIGINLFPTGQSTPEQVVEQADLAMYHSKKSGKNRFTFYNEQLDRESKKFLLMRSEIDKGLKNREFIVRYQPKVSLKNGEVVGLEALTVWDSSSFGLMEPEKFLRYAYGNRLLYLFTEYVIERALEALQRWERRQIAPRVSINLPTEQFNNSAFMNEIYARVAGKYAPQIMFEIVEDALIKDSRSAIETIEKFRKIGVLFSIDDFGTGYSSFNYLKMLPADELKIDRSFVINIFEEKNNEIVRKIVELAKIFGFSVTAEGVESQEAITFLKAIGCDNYQGYYFSKAVGEDEVPGFFEKG